MVIAIVTVLAGSLALLRIPVSQLPDIVPPQVSVTTRFPGASAAVVEQTIGQVIESSVNGVDRMIYMRSNSAKSGSQKPSALTNTIGLAWRPSCDQVSCSTNSSSVPRPPGSATKASDLVNISCFR